MVATLILGINVERRTGSSPVMGTFRKNDGFQIRANCSFYENTLQQIFFTMLR